jgi:predicted acetyltransferase
VVEIRPIRKDEFEAFTRVDTLGFTTAPPTPEQRERFRRGFEFDRSAVAFDGPSMVGTSASYSFELTVPGGALLPTGGLSWVSVVPTHRRQGVLTRMMRAQLEDCRDRGEAASALYASESLIYRRFGYEISAPHEHWHIERDHAQFEFELPTAGQLRLVEHDEALRRLPQLYDRIRRQRPGMTNVTDESWASNEEFLPAESAEKPSKRLYVFYERDGRDEGFATYDAGARSYDPGDAVARRNLEVHLALATTDEAHFAIWRYLLSIDLVTRIDCLNCPPDDALFWMLADPRHLVRQTDDGLWLLDVPAALSARDYSADGALNIEVTDGFCDWVAGRFRLEVEAGEARCEPTEAAADLVLDVATLSGAYLGGPGLATLARAGRVEERTAGAIALADRMFRGERAPWNAYMF